jgi:hypothetical protein
MMAGPRAVQSADLKVAQTAHCSVGLMVVRRADLMADLSVDSMAARRVGQMAYR